METKKNIKLYNDQAELDRIIAFVEDAGEKWGFNTKITGEINLMLEELFINTVSYAYNENASGTIEIEFEYIPGSPLIIRYYDDGGAFDPLSIKSADTGTDIMERQIGGLGMHLIRKLSDRVEYERKNELNLLTIVKKI